MCHETKLENVLSLLQESKYGTTQQLHYYKSADHIFESQASNYQQKRVTTKSISTLVLLQ